MKVAIRDIEKTTGLFKKETHKGVCLNVTLSPEELEIIERVGLDKIPLNSFSTTQWYKKMAREFGDVHSVTVGRLVVKNGEDMEEWFDNNLDITNFKIEIKQELSELKEAIERFSKPSKDETFEL